MVEPVILESSSSAVTPTGTIKSIHFDNQVYSYSRCDAILCTCMHRYFAILMWQVEGTILAAVVVVVVTTAAVLTLVIATRVVAAAVVVATTSQTAA